MSVERTSGVNERENPIKAIQISLDQNKVIKRTLSFLVLKLCFKINRVYSYLN